VRQAPKFINDTFISWLKQKEREMRQMDRALREGESRAGRDRPYQIRDVELLSIEELDESELEMGRPERSSPTGEPGGVPGMGGGVPGMGGGVPGMPPGVPGMRGIERSQPSGGSRTDVTVDELLPSSPLANEARDGDWRFVIKWRVQLIPPEAARKADADNARQADAGQNMM
jgi:hypothetical protein